MKYWKNNPHWMQRENESDPDRDPEHGCDYCGWVEDDGVEASDLLWNPSPAGGVWLCMECD